MKYKTRLKVLDDMSIQGVCSCTWRGNSLSQRAGIEIAMAAAQAEIQAHKHTPKPRRAKK